MTFAVASWLNFILRVSVVLSVYKANYVRYQIKGRGKGRIIAGIKAITVENACYRYIGGRIISTLFFSYRSFIKTGSNIGLYLFCV